MLTYISNSRLRVPVYLEIYGGRINNGIMLPFCQLISDVFMCMPGKTVLRLNWTILYVGLKLA